MGRFDFVSTVFTCISRIFTSSISASKIVEDAFQIAFKLFDLLVRKAFVINIFDLFCHAIVFIFECGGFFSQA